MNEEIMDHHHHSSEETMDSEETEDNSSSSSSSSSSSTESDEEFKTGKITLKARKDRRSRGKWKLLSTKKKFKKEWLTQYCKFHCMNCILKNIYSSSYIIFHHFASSCTFLHLKNIME